MKRNRGPLSPAQITRKVIRRLGPLTPSVAASAGHKASCNARQLSHVDLGRLSAEGHTACTCSTVTVVRTRVVSLPRPARDRAPREERDVRSKCPDCGALCSSTCLACEASPPAL